MDNLTNTLTFYESVRKRPAMYFGATGGKGVIRLIDELIKECMELCESEDFIFTVSINSDNSFSIEINGKNNLLPFLQCLSHTIINPDHISTMAVAAVSTRIEISNDKIQTVFNEGQWQLNDYGNIFNHQTNVIIACEIDQKVFGDTNIDYLALNQELVLIPIVNRKTEILVKDGRKKYLSQNYYHFPQGVFYVFDSIINSLNGKPNLQIKYESSVNEYEYQIALAGWNWAPSLTSFANYIHTTCNGSLVDGIIDGIILGCKKYSKENNLEYFKVTRKNILKNLIIVCAVKGSTFDYGGSFKEKLLSYDVQTQSKELVFKWIYDYLQNDENVRNLFISHFDERRLFSFER